MTIDEIKRALVKVSEMCKVRNTCQGCQLSNPNTKTPTCRLCDLHLVTSVPPMDWRVDDWKEDSNG